MYDHRVIAHKHTAPLSIVLVLCFIVVLFILININLITYYRLSKYKGEHDDDNGNGCTLYTRTLYTRTHTLKFMLKS